VGRRHRNESGSGACGSVRLRWFRGRLASLPFVLLAFLASTGCENLAAGRAGQAEVVLSGNGVNPPSPQDEAPYQGTVTAGFRVYLETSGGFPFQIAARESATVDLRGDVPVSLGSVVVTSGLYSSVRVVFSHVMAEVTAGFGGASAAEGGTVTVDFQGAQTLPVELVSSILVEENGRIEITLALHAPDWIGAAVPSGSQRVVPANVFRENVEILVRYR